MSGIFCVPSLLIVAVIQCGVVFAQNVSYLPKFPPGDHRNCPTAKEIYRFEVLPGSGWDNLRNHHMGVVFQKNYSQCKISEDGKFLLPNNVNILPVKNSIVEMFSELYDHWNNYSSATAKSINAEVSAEFKMFSVSGSFSSEFESVKKHQVEDNSVTTRVQIRHDLYIATLQPGSALQPEFKSRLLEIASHLQYNNTQYANFLAQLLIRDYGTHYITSVNAGAILSKVDHLTKAFVSNFEGERSKITAAASASFFGVFGGNFSGKLSYSYSSGRQELDAYTKNIVHSTVYTYGGPPLRVDFSINRWEDQLLDELVAIDRSGDPLHYAITPASLPEITDRLSFRLTATVKAAIDLYYTHNTIKGCTKKDSPNFSFRANYDDGSCEKPTNNYTFGGVYQTCQYIGTQMGDPCQNLLQPNPLTSQYSCSDGYEAVLIHEGFTTERCRTECEDCGFLWLFTCCKKYCGYAYYLTYWCFATGEVPPNTGYLFGGLYSDAVNNPVTQAHSCPLKFYSLRIGTTIRVCVSDDYELSYEQSVPFGGFFSCRAGNPLGVGKCDRGILYFIIFRICEPLKMVANMMLA